MSRANSVAFAYCRVTSAAFTYAYEKPQCGTAYAASPADRRAEAARESELTNRCDRAVTRSTNQGPCTAIRCYPSRNCRSYSATPLSARLAASKPAYHACRSWG